MAIHALDNQTLQQQAFLAYNKGDDCPKEIRDALMMPYALGSVEYAKQRVEYHLRS